MLDSAFNKESLSIYRINISLPSSPTRKSTLQGGIAIASISLMQ